MTVMFKLAHLAAAALWTVLSSATRPNILFIMVDDLGWNDVSFHGSCDFDTPKLDALHADSLELHNYYVQHICSPSRAAFLGGRYPINTGLQNDVIDASAAYGTPLDHMFVSQDLQRAGYGTHLIGKWHVGFFSWSHTPTFRGFDTFYGMYNGEENYFQHQLSWESVGGRDLRNGTDCDYEEETYSTYLYGNETLRILKQYAKQKKTNPDADKPFFLFLSYQAVHSPLQAPDDVVAIYEHRIANESRRTLAAMATVVDWSVGQITDYLKSDAAANLWDDTLVVITTDNGGPVDMGGNNFPLRGSKGTLWEGGVKGVGFVTGGYLPDDRRGQKMNALMHITDWYPTLCSFADVIPNDVHLLDGFDQSGNLMVGESDLYEPRQEILHNVDPIHCNEVVCGAVRWKNWKLVIGKEVSDVLYPMRSTWMVPHGVDPDSSTIQCNPNDANAKYPDYHLNNFMKTTCPYNGGRCLYNILSDPCEWHDVSVKYPEIADAMWDKLLYYNTTMKTPLNTIYGTNVTAADPAALDGFWGPWIQDHPSMLSTYEYEWKFLRNDPEETWKEVMEKSSFVSDKIVTAHSFAAAFGQRISWSVVKLTTVFVAVLLMGYTLWRHCSGDSYKRIDDAERIDSPQCAL